VANFAPLFQRVPEIRQGRIRKSKLPQDQRSLGQVCHLGMEKTGSKLTMLTWIVERNRLIEMASAF
jgi:hypothetical protein